MILGGVTLPIDAWIDPPDLAAAGRVTVEYDIDGNAVVFTQPRQGGEVLTIRAGLTDHVMAAQIAPMTGTAQSLVLDDRTLQVAVESVTAEPVRQYPSYQATDPILLTITVRKLP